MWPSYHAARTSKTNLAIWASLLSPVAVKSSPIFCQYVGNVMFKALITRHYPLKDFVVSSDRLELLTIEETYSLRYAAGFIRKETI